MHVVVAYVAQGVEFLISLELPDGASVQDAPSAADPWAALEQIVTHQSGGWLFHST